MQNCYSGTKIYSSFRHSFEKTFYYGAVTVFFVAIFKRSFSVLPNFPFVTIVLRAILRFATAHQIC